MFNLILNRAAVRVLSFLGLAVFILAGTGLLLAQQPIVISPEGDEFATSPAPILQVGMSADGKLAFSGDAARVIRVWDVASRKLLRKIEDKSTNRNVVPSYAFSANGKYVLVGYRNPSRAAFRGNTSFLPVLNGPITLDQDTLVVWNLETGAKLHAFPTNGEQVCQVGISPNGQWALSLSEYKDFQYLDIANNLRIVRSRELIVWNTFNGEKKRTLYQEKAWEGFISAIAISFEGDFFGAFVRVDTEGMDVSPQKTASKMSQNWVCNLKLWQANNDREVESMLVGLRWGISKFAFSSDQKQLAAIRDGVLYVYDLKTGKKEWKLWESPNEKEWWIESLIFSGNHRYLLAGGPTGVWRDGYPPGKKGGIYILDAETGKRNPQFEKVDDWIMSATFSPDSKWFLGGTSSGVQFWDVETGRKAFLLENGK